MPNEMLDSGEIQAIVEMVYDKLSNERYDYMEHRQEYLKDDDLDLEQAAFRVRQWKLCASALRKFNCADSAWRIEDFAHMLMDDMLLHIPDVVISVEDSRASGNCYDETERIADSFDHKPTNAREVAEKWPGYANYIRNAALWRQNRDKEIEEENACPTE